MVEATVMMGKGTATRHRTEEKNTKQKRERKILAPVQIFFPRSQYLRSTENDHRGNSLRNKAQ